jgi:hypothetical protein
MTLMNARVRRHRTVTDVAISMLSIAAVVALVLAIDSRASRELWRVVHGGADGTTLSGHTAMLARSGWDLIGMHAPMAVFTAVAVVLVLCMVRMK